MSGLVQFKLTGFRELQDQLVDLGAEVGIAALAQAARIAFKPVLEAAQALVPKKSGALRAALKLQVVKPNSGGDLAVAVGIRITGGAKASNGSALLGGKEISPRSRWHFIEFGTAHIAPHSFLRKALDTNADAVLAQLKIEISRSIAKALKKRGKG